MIGVVKPIIKKSTIVNVKQKSTKFFLVGSNFTLFRMAKKANKNTKIFSKTEGINRIPRMSEIQGLVKVFMSAAGIDFKMDQKLWSSA
jgi:hypothetical protein